MLEWFIDNETLVGWLLFLSLLSLLATFLLVPVILVRLPEDYFSFPDRHRIPWNDRHRFLRIPIFLFKNLLGLIFIVAGILMLVLPGQGILTIIMGLIIMEFPRKYRAERWIVSQASVLRMINWIRRKSGKAALVL